MIELKTAPSVSPTKSHLPKDFPANACIGENTVISSATFRRYRSELERGLVIGEHCTMDGVHFSTGPNGQIEVGDYCYFTNSLLLCEQQIKIGNYVVLGWNATIADSDFHPIAPAQRMLDTEACSPISIGRMRQAATCRAVIIEDDVWVGPNATILKGVRIGRGSFIEPGAMVTRSVPPGSRVLGNPAQVIGTVN